MQEPFRSPHCDEGNPLIEAAKLDAKPALTRPAHAGTNGAAGNLAPIRMRPSNPVCTNVRAGHDETPSPEPVEIQLQSILQTNTLARA